METEIKETVAQRAKRLISTVPEEDFITEMFTNKVDKCCVVGHYNRLTSKNPSDYSIENCALEHKHESDLIHGSNKFLNPEASADIIDVNNGYIEKYNQPSIKGRSLAMLDDMIKAGY